MGNYNWKLIVESKSDKELETFLENDSFLDCEARFFALNEMKRRNLLNEKLVEYKKQLLETCEESYRNYSKTTLREYLIVLNSYIILSIGVIFFLKLLFTIGEIRLNSPIFLASLFFLTGGLLAYIVARIRMNKIKNEKNEKKRILETIISELKN
jgi:hypothetical protein